MVVVWVIVAILFIALMVLIHEGGHFLAARAVGIKVKQFSIGFGPEIVGWDRGGTRYSLKWVLAGGSVKILGMDPDEEVPPEDEPFSYYRAKHWKRAVVVLAGSVSHLLVAIFLFFLFFWPVGYPVLTGRIGNVEKEVEISEGVKVESPAYEAGLKKSDLITHVNGKPVKNWGELSEELGKHPNEMVTLTVKRGSKSFTVQTELLEVGNRGFLGVEVDVNDTYTERESPGGAFIDAFKTTGEVCVLQVKGLGQLFSPDTLKILIGAKERTQESPRSIIGAAQITYQAARVSPSMFIFILAQIFLFLAIFNLIPLPPFDGGHLLVIIVEKLFHKEIDMRKLTPVAVAVIVILSIMALRLAFLDVFKPISNPFKP